MKNKAYPMQIGIGLLIKQMLILFSIQRFLWGDTV